MKRYDDHTYKLVYMHTLRTSGFEEQDPSKVKRSKGNEAEKLSESLSRTRSRIFELARCNPWEYFVTLTLDPGRNDRFDLHGTYKRLSKWFNNLSRQGFSLSYLLVPEPHKDGAWHFHGLLFGLPLSNLTPFTLRDRIPKRLKDLIRAGHTLYNWPSYAKAFGFVCLEPVRDPDRISSYMTKYITKELGQSSIELNYHLYYSSKGLRRAEVIYRGPMTHRIENPDFENEYLAIKQFSSPEEALPYFCDKEC